MDSTQLDKSLGKMKDKLKAFSRNLGAIGGTLAAAGAAILLPLAGAIKSYSAAGDQLDKMNKRTGFAVETLSALDFAASQSGASLEQFDKALASMARFSLMASRGLATATDVLDELGLSVEDVTAGSAEQKFLKLAEKISEIEDPTLKAGMALQVFGRQGRELLPMLAGGGQGIEALMARARELGIVMSGEDAQAAAEMTDALDELMRSVKFLTVTVARELLPEALNFSKFMTETIPQIREWLSENGDMIRTLAKLGAMLAATGVGMIALATVISSMSTIVGASQAALKMMGGTLAGVGKTAGTAFAIVAIVAFAREIYKANAAVQDLNSSLEKSRELDGELSGRQSKKQQATLDQANSLSGDEKEAFISSELEMAEKNLAGMQASLAGQKKLLNDLSPTWRSLWQSGRAEFNVEKQELDGINERLKSQKKFVDDLRQARAAEAAELDANAGRTDEEMSGIEGILKGLNEELETMGLDSGQKALRTLEQLNANETELAQARGKLADIEKKTQEAAKQKEAESNAQKVADTLESLWQELADMDLSPIEQAVAEQMRELEALGATPQQLALAEELLRQKEQEATSVEKPGYQESAALEVGSAAAISAFMRATQGGGTPDEKVATNTAEIAKLQAELLRVTKRAASDSEIVIGRPA